MRPRLRLAGLGALIALVSGCYHLAYNQATYAMEHGDYPTAVDKDLEAMENVPDSVEARQLWDRIWPRYRSAMVGACEAAALDPDPSVLHGHLTAFESILARSGKLQVPLPEAPTTQLAQWHNIGASKAYHRGETAEAGTQPREAAEWFRLAQRFVDRYRDSAGRFERNRRTAYVVLRVDDFSALGFGTLPGYGAADQARALLLQGLQPLNDDFLGIYGDHPAPDWAQRRYRLSGNLKVYAEEPVDEKDSGSHQGLQPLPQAPPRQVTVWYTRHHVERKVTISLNLTLSREGDGTVVWQHGFTDSARADNRWLVVDRGPKEILPASLKDEMANPSGPPEWEALQDEAGVETCNTALREVKQVVTDLR
jgi:hypothetical protein